MGEAIVATFIGLSVIFGISLLVLAISITWSFTGEVWKDIKSDG